MKRIAAFFAAVLLLFSYALADINLASMTLEELIALKQKIDLEIASRPEVKSVTVPIGVWKIGEDIPAGHWSFTVEAGHFFEWAHIIYCDVLDATGKKISSKSEVYYKESIKCVGADQRTIELTTIDLDMKDDMYLIIENAPVILTPFTGKPDLGFDW